MVGNPRLNRFSSNYLTDLRISLINQIYGINGRFSLPYKRFWFKNGVWKVVLGTQNAKRSSQTKSCGKRSDHQGDVFFLQRFRTQSNSNGMSSVIQLIDPNWFRQISMFFFTWCNIWPENVRGGRDVNIFEDGGAGVLRQGNECQIKAHQETTSKNSKKK